MKVIYLPVTHTQKLNEKAFFDTGEVSDLKVDVRGVVDGKVYQRFFRALFTKYKLSDYDVVVTSEFYVALATCLRLVFSGSNVRHVIIGLNQSSYIPTKGILRAIVTKLFEKVNAVVVHSILERKMFSELYSIPLGKITFLHWGFDLPSVNSVKFDTMSRPYIALIGRNNRDVSFFINAMSRIEGLDGIVITSKANVTNEVIPENVHLYTDLPMDDCLNCMQNSLLNAIILNDDSRGAGHITLVASMMMGKPQIFTKAKAIAEYCENSVHGFSLENKTFECFEHAIKKALNVECYDFLSNNAKEMAGKYFTNQVFSESVKKIIVGDKSIEEIDIKWFSECQERKIK